MKQPATKTYADILRIAQDEYITYGVPWVPAYDLYNARVEKRVTRLKAYDFEQILLENVRSTNEYVRQWEVNATGDHYHLLYHLNEPPRAVANVWGMTLQGQPDQSLSALLVTLLGLLTWWRKEAAHYSLPNEDVYHIQLILWAGGYRYSIRGIETAAKHTNGVISVEADRVIYKPELQKEPNMAFATQGPTIAETLQTDDIVTDPARTDVGMPTLFRSVVAPPPQPTDLTAPSPTQLLEISKRWLDDEPFDLARIRVECRALTANLMTTMIALGDRLNAVRETMTFERWKSWVEEDTQLPFGLRMALQYMAVSKACKERPELRKLNLTDTNKAGMLLTLPEPALEEMATKGTLGGTPLDDVQTMTRAELVKYTRSLKKQMTELKEAVAGQSQELVKVRDELSETQRKAGQLLLNPTARKPVELELERTLAELEGQLSERLRLVDSLSVDQLSGPFQVKLAHQLLLFAYMTERSRLLLCEKVSDLYPDLAPDDTAYERNEARAPKKG